VKQAIPEDTTAEPSTRAIPWEALAQYRAGSVEDWIGGGTVTLLRRQVVRVVEGFVTYGTVPSIGHGFRRPRRGNERQAPAFALQGGDVGPCVQVDHFHFHTRFSLTAAVARRRYAEMAWPSIRGAPAAHRQMGRCRASGGGVHRPGRSDSRGGRSGSSRVASESEKVFQSEHFGEAKARTSFTERSDATGRHRDDRGYQC
jgi:hypothetical protein